MRDWALLGQSVVIQAGGSGVGKRLGRAQRSKRTRERGDVGCKKMDDENFQQLLELAQRGEAPAVLAALEQEPGLVNRVCEVGESTILHGACSGGHVDLARVLLERQADLNQRCTLGWDALMWASASGHIPVIEFLLSRGADLTAQDNDGETALGRAAFSDKLPACKFLISRGSDLIVKNNQGQTVLDIYGDGSSLSDEEKEERREELRALFASLQQGETVA